MVLRHGVRPAIERAAGRVRKRPPLDVVIVLWLTARDLRRPFRGSSVRGDRHIINVRRHGVVSLQRPPGARERAKAMSRPKIYPLWSGNKQLLEQQSGASPEQKQWKLATWNRSHGDPSEDIYIPEPQGPVPSIHFHPMSPLRFANKNRSRPWRSMSTRLT